MSDEQAPALIRHLSGFYAFWIVALAERTGLLDALVEAPGTADELATRCGLDERNTLEALRGLVAADVAVVDDEGFALADDARAVLDPGFPVDLRAALKVNGSFSPLLGIVADAMRTGSGVSFETYRAVMGEGLAHMGEMNLPGYRMVLVPDWLLGTPAVRAVLDGPADVVDVGCAAGDTVRLVAEAFPQARVQGWDPEAPSRADLPGNASLHVGGLADVPSAAADLVYCLDVFHHLGDADTNAAELRRVLRPGGVLLLAEETGTGDLSIDAADRMATLAYGSRLVYCMQDSLASGGRGLTSSDGTGWITSALADAGFTDISSRDTELGMRLIIARA